MTGLDYDAHWLWLLAAIVMAIAELLVPGVFLIWLAAAAAGTGLLTLVFGISFAFQIVLFALLAIGAVYAGRKWYSANPVESSDPLLNQRAARLVGETVVVVTAIEDGRGRVKVGDSVWNCRGPDCEAGSRVRVTGADGSCLTVVRLAELPPA